MVKEFKDFTDGELIDSFHNFGDEEDAISILLELARRNHPNLADFCKIIFQRGEFEQHDRRVSIFLMYNYALDDAILYIKENYKKWHHLVIGQIMESLWTESNIYQENEGKAEPVKLIKHYAKTFGKEKIADIQEDYGRFMQVYKHV